MLKNKVKTIGEKSVQQTWKLWLVSTCEWVVKHAVDMWALGSWGENVPY